MTVWCRLLTIPTVSLRTHETGQTITGVWHLTRGDDICHNGEAEVIEGPLSVPLK